MARKNPTASGPYFWVRMSKTEVRDFKKSWPNSGLPDSYLGMQLNRYGDLVQTDPKAVFGSTATDQSALSVLVSDARKLLLKKGKIRQEDINAAVEGLTGTGVPGYTCPHGNSWMSGCADCDAAERVGNPFDREHLLREWKGGDGFSLRLYETGRTDSYGKVILGYEFRHHGKIIFTGSDYHLGAGMESDGDEAVGGLLGFLSLRPGDTDPEWFDKYTPKQKAWAERYGEELAIEGIELEEGRSANPRPRIKPHTYRGKKGKLSGDDISAGVERAGNPRGRHSPVASSLLTRILLTAEDGEDDSRYGEGFEAILEKGRAWRAKTGRWKGTDREAQDILKDMARAIYSDGYEYSYGGNFEDLFAEVGSLYPSDRKHNPLRITKGEYRGKKGFKVSGRPKGQQGGWPVAIFTETRASAEHMRDKLNRGEQTTPADFSVGACGDCDCSDPTALPGLKSECGCHCHRAGNPGRLGPADTAYLRKFEYTNKAGGTGLSSDPPFHGTAWARVTKVWHDYEIGWRYHGTAVSRDLKAYMRANAKRGTPVLFGEFDLAGDRAGEGNRCPTCGEAALMTADGRVSCMACREDLDPRAGNPSDNVLAAQVIQMLKDFGLEGAVVGTGGGCEGIEALFPAAHAELDPRYLGGALLVTDSEGGVHFMEGPQGEPLTVPNFTLSLYDADGSYLWDSSRDIDRGGGEDTFLHSVGDLREAIAESTRIYPRSGGR